MKYKVQWKLKKYSIAITLSTIMLTTVFTIAYLNDRVIETLLTIVAYYVYRSFYEKQAHAKTLFQCTIVTIIVLGIVTKIALPLQVSMFCTVLISFAITHISYLIRDLLDKVVLVETYRKRLEAFEHKAIENLTELELIARVPNIPYEIVHIVYGYLHKGNTVNATAYAMKHHISEATLYRYLKRVKSEYESLE